MFRRDFAGSIGESPRRVRQNGSKFATGCKSHEVNARSSWLLIHVRPPDSLDIEDGTKRTCTRLSPCGPDAEFVLLVGSRASSQVEKFGYELLTFSRENEARGRLGKVVQPAVLRNGATRFSIASSTGHNSLFMPPLKTSRIIVRSSSFEGSCRDRTVTRERSGARCAADSDGCVPGGARKPARRHTACSRKV